MSTHHLVVFANYVRDTGFTLIEAVRYVGDHYDELAEIDNDLIIAYDETYNELMQFANMVID